MSYSELADAAFPVFECGLFRLRPRALIGFLPGSFPEEVETAFACSSCSLKALMYGSSVEEFDKDFIFLACPIREVVRRFPGVVGHAFLVRSSSGDDIQSRHF